MCCSSRCNDSKTKYSRVVKEWMTDMAAIQTDKPSKGTTAILHQKLHSGS